MRGLGPWLLDELLRRQLDVRVRVHRANILLPGGRPSDAWFINVWNASPRRSIGITHVWLETNPQVHVTARVPPARLEPDAQWETWVKAADMPPGAGDVTRLARVKLTNGKVVHSGLRTDVPPAGLVPG